MHRLPVLLGVLLAAILALGLGNVLWKNLRVAPWRSQADAGRLHLHLKNTTRWPGGPADVRRAVARAVHLHELRSDPPDDAQAEFASVHRVRNEAGHVVALPSGRDALAWALPGMFWAVYAGVPAVFVGGATAGEEALARIRELGRPVFLLAPESIASAAVLAELTRVARTTRIAAEDPAAHAVAVAEFHDPTTGFGWGRTQDQRDGYFEFVVTTPSEADAAVQALPLARSNAAALLFSADDGGVPAPTDRYVFQQRADWFVTPAEGPFRHLWIVGDRTSYAAQSRLDHALEKGPYPDRGATALGPLEGLLVVFMAVGIASGIFVGVHAARLLPDVPLGMRLAWALTAMLLPLLGPVLYLAAYRRPVAHRAGQAPAFERPAAVQAAAATAMGFGYGAPLMIVIAFAFAWSGWPLEFGEFAVDGPQFLLGAGMPIMMFAMWAGAILIAWLCAQLPLQREFMPQMAWPRLLWRTFAITTVSMTAVSLGMMTMAWWLQMVRLPMMPKEDEVLFFGVLWLASPVGFLIAWPLNEPLIRVRLKAGNR